MGRKQFGDYYLGLDIGTDSVGWAVTDKEYNILNFNGKAMWGVHLFEGGKTAEDRRVHRIARRRLERRKNRIDLLQSLFAEEVSKTDFTFFQRMNESRLVMEDRTHKHHDTLFNDPNFRDKDLHKRYPTIYHLRKELMEPKEKPDIRLLYLACHHIIKYRGHFLFDTIGGDIPSFEQVYGDVIEVLNRECETDLPMDSANFVQSILADSNLGMKEKKTKLYELIGEQTESAKAFMDLIAGSNPSVGKLFGIDDIKDKLTFKNTDFEDEKAKLEEKLDPEQIELIERAKALYDSSELEKLIGTYGSISRYKVAQFEQHKKDLSMLKAILKKNRPLYLSVFKSDATENNYSAYVKVYKKKGTEMKSCTQTEFCDFLKKNLKDVLECPMFSTGEWKEMKERIESGTFMPKQVSKDNSMFPNSLHSNELKKILENASAHYPFLSQKDEFGDSVKDKIEKICTFRIPYYVGPLVSQEQSERAWFVRKENGEITPWNFERKVDLDASGEKFIKNLINKCTYLPTEDVLPKNSTLYSRYMLYNEINNLTINDERIQPKLKSQMILELFEQPASAGKVTVKVIEDWLRGKGLWKKGDEIKGIDISLKASLKAENLLKPIIGDVRGDRKMAEDVIRIITIFGDDRSRLKKKLYADYKDKLTDDQIEKLSKLKFSDWGRFSEKFLIGIRAPVDGVEMCILEALETTNLNLQELLGNKYGFIKKIEEIKRPDLSDGRITYDMLDDLYISPTVKRGIWRSMSIVKDIVKITGHAPAKVFVETTREDMDDKKRTESRLDRLKRLYKACSEQEHELASELENETESRLRIKNLYAYYCQNGKCMYCGKKIDLNDLFGNNTYDLDHIHPRSKKMDDSINNNLVLVCKEHNHEKGDSYPLPEEWQNRMRDTWLYLKDCEFITPEKYRRLVRPSPLTEAELAGFINRQLVETSQTVKAVIELMKRVFGDKTDVVYVKANAVSDFRIGNNGYAKKSNEDPSLKFIKCRSVNDYHHAKDAYLNIVVGNVYDVKFTKDFAKFIRSGEKYSLRLDRLLMHDIERGGVCAWKAGNDGTIKTVSKYMKRNNILFTRFAYEVKGELYDVLSLKKDRGQFRLKKDLPIEKYGGYNKVRGSYFALVEHGKPKERIRTIQPVPVYLNSKPLLNEDLEYYYSKKGFEDPKVIVPKIRTYCLMEIDGFRVHIAGRTNKSIVYLCAEQAILSECDYEYCKRIFNHTTKSKEAKKMLPAYDYGIDSEMNLSLYDVLATKYGGSKYGIFFKGLSQKLIEGREIFISLSPEEQSKLLNEILHAFQCNATYVDLRAINGPAKTGMIQKNSNLATFNSVKIINQSPSGLFEREVDLKQI